MKNRTAKSADKRSRSTARQASAPAAAPRLGYRFLTGPDTRAFCEKVSAALAEGYVLYGPPLLAFDDGEAYCGQAVILRALAEPSPAPTPRKRRAPPSR
jgi:hypothetical protein